MCCYVISLEPRDREKKKGEGLHWRLEWGRRQERLPAASGERRPEREEAWRPERMGARERKWRSVAWRSAASLRCFASVLVLLDLEFWTRSLVFLQSRPALRSQRLAVTQSERRSPRSCLLAVWLATLLLRQFTSGLWVSLSATASDWFKAGLAEIHCLRWWFTGASSYRATDIPGQSGLTLAAVECS